MEHYTFRKMVKEVGESNSYKVAKITSIKKWKEIVRCGANYYAETSPCGFCTVFRNINVTGCVDTDSKICPAKKICVADISPKKKLKALKKLKV